MRLVTAAEMRALDGATIASGSASGFELMERAGRGVADVLERRHGAMLAWRVLVLAGTGNNGGDGFVAARELAARGADVVVGIAGAPERLRGDARAHYERLAGARVGAATVFASEEDLARLVAMRDGWDFALDALLGTGARGAPEGPIAAAVQALRELDERGTRVIAVDVPTGVDADTGAIARRTVRADLTVTFGCPKRGQWLYPGRAFTGALEVVDIGLVDRVADETAAAWTEITSFSEMAAFVPHRGPRAHKGSVGRVLVIGGAPGMIGAVALAARGAARSGAGYVTAAVPASLADVLAAKLTEEMVLAVPESSARTLCAGALPDLFARAAANDVVALGSGLSRHPEARAAALALLARSDRTVVVDADALNALGQGDAVGVGLHGPAGAARILTPHLGEMARLTGLDPTALEADRIEQARQWAQRWNAVVVLKGAPTVTARPGGHVTVNSSGNPGLATAGTGDVLCGTIAALAAQGLSAYDAARFGAFVHGEAGDRAAHLLGVHGMCAGDVVEELPRAMKRLDEAVR